ncbi:MAG: disulfide bond formation protein B [Gammaproteobacteria bacterium]|nr:disulfide bond formation protein B [Gammaproteobacteria bacterium]
MNKITNIAFDDRYWLLALFSGFALLAVALMFQYGLDEQPCVMCIHVRLWISLLIIVVVIRLLINRRPLFNSISHFIMTLIAIGLTERSYQLLGTERGFLFGSCNFSLGFPDWLAFDQWLPSIYGVETSCGYTPKLIFDITMAEALIVMSALFLIISSSLFVMSLFKKK